MLREYRHYRMVNTKLHSLITAEYLDQATLEKAARLLKLTRNREIVLVAMTMPTRFSIVQFTKCVRQTVRRASNAMPKR
ncbi:hypothetical protein [Thermogutta terrifontis]|uniref:hypothetical protein n=1 Tax=Thermogutta terrifontis TaxID=1331910 RepID=UPI000BA8C350|nr:hypothetical protein [Thermogutta terrifontis]